jgi:ribosomal protein S4
MSGRVVSAPTRDQIDMPPINEQLIIEFYSR